MSNFTIPQSRKGEFLQVIAPGSTSADDVDGTTDNVALPSGAEVVRIAVSQDCYIAFGDVSVTATSADILMLRGVEVMKVPSGATYIAYLQVSAAGRISVTAAGD